MSVFGSAALVAVLTAAGCGGGAGHSGFGDDPASDADGGLGGDGDPQFGDAAGGPKPGCVGLKCQQVDCPGGATTSISGVTYAPNGTLPLYNVIVYVPNAKLDPMVEGATCDKCGSIASGNPIVTALSDSSGKFKLTNVPSGDNIPIVLQVGKWRREITIPHVEACKETKLTSPEMTRLPKKQSEGNMPRIAVTTGSCDPMACLLPKMGIDSSEFGFDADIGTKKVIFYQGVGPTWGSMTPAQNFWNDAAKLKKFDMTMLSCECSENTQNKGPAAYAAMDEYLKAGGRALGTDFMYTWFRYGPAPLPTTAQVWYGGAPFDSAGVFDVDMTFPKGKAFGEWLVSVGGSTTLGKIPIATAFSNLSRVNSTIAQRWISKSTDKVFTFNTPIEAAPADQCGKAVFLDAHIGGSDVVDGTFPAGCKGELTPPEKAFVFFLMDLSSCIQPDNGMVTPPPVK
ncbi:MAG: carboxypeptidase regulatory-like domain-containing protein [Polyangiaceae bacterium]